MTASEMMKRIGSEGYVQLQGLKIRVKVIDARTGWGRIRWVVRPSDPGSAGELVTETVIFDD